VHVISTSRCGPVCLSAWLSVASAIFATFRTEVTRYLSRCESERSVIVSPTLILSSRAKKPMPSVAESTCPAITVEPKGSPATHVLDVLGHFEYAVDSGRREHFRARLSGQCESLWNKFDPLTRSRSTLAGRGDRRATTRRITRGDRDTRYGLGSAGGKARQQEQDHDGTTDDGMTQSRSTPLQAPEPGPQGS
jgi:hypothetical protein